MYIVGDTSYLLLDWNEREKKNNKKSISAASHFSCSQIFSYY